MKIAVFGASGQTGKQVVQQALDQGHEVKAYVRDPDKLQITDERLEIIQGDVLDSQTVDRAIEGVDAAILALGSKPDTAPNVLAQGTTNIINAMKKHAVKRIIVESSYPMSGAPEGMEFLKKSGMDEAQIAAVKPMLDDKVNQEKEVRESGLEWIIVRPLMLTNEVKTGSYRVGEKLDVKPGDKISRADVADFMLKKLQNDEWLQKTVTISY